MVVVQKLPYLWTNYRQWTLTSCKSALIVADSQSNLKYQKCGYLVTHPRGFIQRKPLICLLSYLFCIRVNAHQLLIKCEFTARAPSALGNSSSDNRWAQVGRLPTHPQ